MTTPEVVLTTYHALFQSLIWLSGVDPPTRTYIMSLRSKSELLELWLGCITLKAARLI